MSDERLPDYQFPEHTQPVQGYPQPATRPASMPTAASYQPSVPTSYQPTVPMPGYAMSHTTVSGGGAGGVHITIAWIFAVLTFGYFLPWAVAATRHKSNALAIALLNFFVGWTVIGWIAALVMACASEPVRVDNLAYAFAPAVPHPAPPTLPPPGWYANGTGQRYWDGRAWTEHAAP